MLKAKETNRCNEVKHKEFLSENFHMRFCHHLTDSGPSVELLLSQLQLAVWALVLQIWWFRGHMNTRSGQWIGGWGRITWPWKTPNFVLYDFYLWSCVWSVMSVVLGRWPAQITAAVEHINPRDGLKLSINWMSVTRWNKGTWKCTDRNLFTSPSFQWIMKVTFTIWVIKILHI
jgi:hypothetical protein